MASALMSMNYDSDSDSAEDLDFEPESDLSQDSDFDSDSDKSLDEHELVDDSAAPVAAAKDEDTLKPADAPASSTVQAPSVDPSEPKKRPKGRPRKVVDPNNPSRTAPKTTKSRAKKSTATKRSDNSTPAKTKKASKAAQKKNQSAEESHAGSSQLLVPAQNTPRTIDMNHPFETFRWPFSAFSPEFLKQHQERDKMVRDLRQAVEEMVGSNTNASWRLQELEERVETRRQELRMTLDEISFRKSQLRDMSRMAVDIVKKLSSRRDYHHPQPPQLEQQPTQQRCSSPDMCIDQPMDADRMDIDTAPLAVSDAAVATGTAAQTSAPEQTDNNFTAMLPVSSASKGGHDEAQSRDSVNTDMTDPSSLHLAEPNMTEAASSSAQTNQAHQRKDINEHLSGLNEYNIRSFLERIRQLELERREMWSSSSHENGQVAQNLSLQQ
ncbi:hypothetical protein BGW42_003782 [Actinomortierella wolfii]|nr:hypothetical protein BGW42_003782 [Actinomortierella wolfii]